MDKTTISTGPFDGCEGSFCSSSVAATGFFLAHGKKKEKMI
jgi:hypothetical protein